ncbi:MAG: 4Fe-4S dicluster domain-containing protein [Anaerolineales bacterium]
MNQSFSELIQALSQQSLSLCFHCHKCTAGCPVVVEMDYGADRILRMIQLGEREKVLQSRDIWLCAACETCGARCPNGINIARVMDALRFEAIQSGILGPEKDAVKFHKLFLFVVQTLGRTHEASLLLAYKLWTMHLMADMDSGVQLILKGKVPLIPKRIKSQKTVQHIFDQSARFAKEQIAQTEQVGEAK